MKTTPRGTIYSRW